MKVLITCDDMTPRSIPIWINTWDKLKAKYPELVLTVFVIPIWKGRLNNDIFKDKEFSRWYEPRKNWIEIAQLGYNYGKPPECLRMAKPQYALLKRGYRKTMSFMPEKIHSFKAPGYKMNSNTLQILQDLGFTCCIYFKNIVFLKKIKKPIPEFVIKETSINAEERKPDSIASIYDKMDKYIEHLVKQNAQMTTISNLINGCIEEQSF